MVNQALTNSNNIRNRLINNRANHRLLIDPHNPLSQFLIQWLLQRGTHLLD
jgi:hypothetical protein